MIIHSFECGECEKSSADDKEIVFCSACNFNLCLVAGSGKLHIARGCLVLVAFPTTRLTHAWSRRLRLTPPRLKQRKIRGHNI